MASYWSKRRKVNREVSRIENEILQEFEKTVETGPHGSKSFQTEEHRFVNLASANTVEARTQSSASNEASSARASDVMAESDGDSEQCAVGSSFSSESAGGSDEDEPKDNMLYMSLKHWAAKFSISLVALTALLCILRVFHPKLPCDGRTLLGTPAKVPTRKMGNGQYYHFGLEQGLLSRLKCLVFPADVIKLKLQFNIDGLPLFKSSRLQFWPILGLLDCDYTRTPFVVGIYCGAGKPGSIFEFLKEFTKDLTHVLTNGIVYCGRSFQVLLSAFVCDAPARAFVKHVKAHNGYYGCDKCTQAGVWKNKMTFPDIAVKPRTDADFAAMVDEDHHLEQKLSPLTSVVKMVSQFPIDYMHLCCLGVTRKLLYFWLRGKNLTTRIQSQVVGLISSKLLGLRPHTPVEFARKPRDLTEVDRWKATELRQLMLYSGPVVLRDCLPSELYDNFMLFSVAMRLLLSPGNNEQMVKFAHDLLVSFVQHFGKLYGSDEVVFTIHQLIHLADEYRQFGPLDNVSGFPFENYLCQIKRLLRKPHQPLQQVVKRLSEATPALVEMPPDTYEMAHSHLKLVEEGCCTSDLQSDEDTEERKKRKMRINTRYSDYVDEDPGESKRRQLAKPPPVVLPEVSPGYTAQEQRSNNGSFRGQWPSNGLGSAHWPEQCFNDSQGSSNPVYHTLQVPEYERNDPIWPESRQVLKDIAVNKLMTILVNIREDIKEARKEILTLQKDVGEIKQWLGTQYESVESLGAALCLPLKTVEDFEEAERQFQTEAVRRKTVSKFAAVGGGTPETTIRRILQSSLTNELACQFNWAGKGCKRPFKDTILKDCIFATACQQHKGLTLLTFSDVVMKWLRYAPEREGGIPRKKN
ncbi:hypothetical protein MHYP_G00188060 [Metynnis hypsauchen]